MTAAETARDEVSPSVEYLAAARAAGLLFEIDGHPLVAGVFEDPVIGVEDCYVEYVDPYLLASPHLSNVHELLRSRFVGVDRIRLRTRCRTELPAPWERLISYISHEGRSGTPPRGASVTARRAIASDDAAVAAWLRAALVDGYHARGHDAREREVRAQAESIVSDPSRATFIAVHDGRPTGHVTLLSDDEDEITGLRRHALVDMLVEPGEHASAARSALMSAVYQYAAVTGLSLLGTVIHGAGDANRRRSLAVMSNLLADGWQVDHVDWWRGS